MAFDESKDGVERCSEFLDELRKLMKEHRVTVHGEWDNLQDSMFKHDDPENGWIVDMQDIQGLVID